MQRQSPIGLSPAPHLTESRSKPSVGGWFVLLFMLTLSTTMLWFASTSSADGPNRAEGPHLPPVLLQMIRDDAIHRDLDLSPTQVAGVLKTLKEVDGDWFRSRIQPARQQNNIIKRLTNQVTARLMDLLDDSQLKRLRQLERQALGTRMVLRNDVIAAMQITADQYQRLTDRFNESDTSTQRIQSRLQAGEIEAEQAADDLGEVQRNERELVIATFTDQQRSKLRSLTGDVFDFSAVKRSLPLAPELTSDGSVWVNGRPLKLEQLHGKVVAVHFYAFQCINCIRNLPHYKAWHEDYADQGLVVIGIQTPETQAERDVKRVAVDAKEEGIVYPLLMDGDSKNWQNWGTTMWPSVYLVDKRGFVRKWWYGELNWKGTAGEQQMRKYIEMLLAEDG